jgi:hypothetical protein
LRLRDRKAVPWYIRHSEIFEAAFYRRLAPAEHEDALDVIELFEKYALINPRMAGDQHPVLLEFWTFETPIALTRLPRIVLTYTIEDQDGSVTLRNLHRL